MYVCLCKGITDTQIREAVDAGAQSVRDVRNELGVSTQCGRCSVHVREVVQSSLEDVASTSLFYQVA